MKKDLKNIVRRTLLIGTTVSCILLLASNLPGGRNPEGFGPMKPTVNPEKWVGAIDLHQGDKGTIEFIREGGRIAGKIIIQRGNNTIETDIKGEWKQNAIFFNRTLTETSYQPFKGTVIFSDPRHVTLEGQFAAEFRGRWTGECELKESEEQGGSTKTPKPEETVRPNPFPATKPPHPTIVTPGLILDLINKAPKAEWTNAHMQIRFPGDPADSSGFVRYVEGAKLEDGHVYPKVLETHPQWRPGGSISGRFANVRIPEAGSELRTGIGFMEGASGSDGVYFSIRGEFSGYSGNDVRREYFKKYDRNLIMDLSQDLSRFKGLEGALIISVNAGPKSAGQDWAAWIEPKLISLENEYKFASFVGGAVGSNRDGNRLTNAWGGKSGNLYGTVIIYLLFANIDRDYPVRIESYHGDQFMGGRDFGMIKAGESEMWHSLQRTVLGEWRESIIFNNTYVGDVRYTIAKGGE